MNEDSLEIVLLALKNELLIYYINEIPLYILRYVF